MDERRDFAKPETERDIRSRMADLDKAFGSVGEQDYEAALRLELSALRLRALHFPSVGEALGTDETPSDNTYEGDMRFLVELWLNHFQPQEGGAAVFPEHGEECVGKGDHYHFRRPASCAGCFYGRLENLQQWSWLARSVLDCVDGALDWIGRGRRGE